MTHEDIARGLSPARRRALLWLSETPQAWPKGSETPLYGLLTFVSGDPTKKVCAIAHLCKVAGKGQPNKRDWFGSTLWVITPLGLAVRAILEREND